MRFTQPTRTRNSALVGTFRTQMVARRRTRRIPEASPRLNPGVAYRRRSGHAVAGGRAMTEAEWLVATDPTPMFATVKGRKYERKLRLFAVACCRRIVPLGDNEAQKALVVAELFADG